MHKYWFKSNIGRFSLCSEQSGSKMGEFLAGAVCRKEENCSTETMMDGMDPITHSTLLHTHTSS